MCNFFSCIITKDFTVLWNKDTDAHEELIEDNKLNDSLKVGNGSRTWMKAEITPKDGDIFNHAPENWEIKIDEQITEQWYLRNKTQYDKAMSHALMGCLSEMFITTGTTENITNGRWFVGGSATIKCVRGSATIKYVKGSATIEYVRDSATIEYVGDSATIEYVGDSATIQDVGDSATIQDVGDSATIKYVRDSATIKYVGDSATIQDVRGSATIQDVRDSATIKASGQSTIIKRTKSECKVEIDEEAMLISRHTKEIEINTKRFSWKQEE